MSVALARTGPAMVSLAPQSFQEAMAFAEKVAQTDMVPDSDRNKPGNILAKIQFGAELGLPPMQSIQKLFCTKGRVGMEVSAMQAVVEASGLCEDLDVAWDEATQTATATTTRTGRKPVTMVFSAEDAKRAGLMGKDLYQKYPQRMLTRRALGFLMQDRYPDVLRGVVHLEQLYEIADADEARPLPQGPAVAVLPVGADVDPAVQAKLSEAFDLCHLAPALRTVKLAEYRGREDELLDWLRAEFAARQGKTISKAASKKAAAPITLVPPTLDPVVSTAAITATVAALVGGSLASGVPEAPSAGEALMVELDKGPITPVVPVAPVPVAWPVAASATPDLFAGAPSAEEIFG